MPEKESLASSLIGAGGRIGEAALVGGLPQALVQKNPLTVLAEQSTALLAVGGLGLVSTIAVAGIIYVTTKSDQDTTESELRFARASFRG